MNKTDGSKSGGISAAKRALLDALQGDDDTPVLAPMEPTMSAEQRRQWFLHQLDPRDVAYNMAGAVWLDGSLDVDALEASLRDLLRRHEVLRARFDDREGEPAIEVYPEVSLRMPRVTLPANDDGTRLRTAIRKEARRPFDLGRAPLVRARLFRVSDTSHVLVVTMHHIVSDAWSVTVLLDEITRTYPSFARGEASPLPPLPAQYWNYAARSVEPRPESDEGLQFWKETLRGAPTLALTTDYSRSERRSGAGGQVPLPLSGDVVAGLRGIAASERTTLFMALVALWKLVLARHTGQRDIVVGAPVANRTDPGSEALIGFFVNTVALRSDLSGSPSFRELLRREREAVLSAMTHASVPFDKVVEAVDPVRDVYRSPIFQTMIVLRSAPAPVSLGELDVRVEHVDVGASQFELTASFEEQPDGHLDAKLEFDGSLFDPSTIEALGRRFAQLLAQVVASPNAPAFELPLLLPEERATVIEAWNDTGRDYPIQLLHEQFAARASEAPDAIALVASGETWTYQQLEDRVTRLARWLFDRGLGHEAIVGIHLARSAELVVAILGALRAGAAYLPLVPSLPAERLTFMAADAGAAALITSSDGAALWDGLDVPRLVLDDAASLDAVEGSLPAPSVHPDQIAYVIYTSGSTGRPKGVLCTHGGLRNRIAWMQEAFALGIEDRVLQKTPFGFDVSVWEFVWPLSRGATLVVAKPGGHQDSQYLLETIEQQGVTVCHFVPPMLDAFLDVLERSRGQSLRLVVTSGEALPDDLAWRFVQRSDAALFNLYGPTEAAIDVTAAACQEADIRQGVTIGKPIANTQVYVVDAALQPVPVGVAGELLLGGVQLARGYLGRPGRTAVSFVPNPFGGHGSRLYRTGDLVRWRHDGQLEYLGRLDHQVKIRGFRIELGEIEARLREQAPDRDWVVVARRSDRGDHELVAYVTADEGELDLEALRRGLSASLPDYMVPRAFVTLATMPLSPNGKIDRRALPAPPRSVGASNGRAPRSGLEQAIADTFTELLGVPTIGAADDFFELGGHSLLATRAAARLRAKLGVAVPLRAFFEAPTVAGLAARLQGTGALGRDRGHDLPPIEPAGPDEPKLSWGQERMWFLHQLEPSSELYNMAGGVRLHGPVDADRLARSIERTVERHETLRMTFATVDGRADATIHDAVEIPLVRIDASTSPDPHAELEAIALAFARPPFDLAEGPLLRCQLVRLGASEHALLVAMHHIVADGWSIDVFTRDLARAYASDAPLPALPIQFSDYAAWQRRQASTGVIEEQLGYWREQLKGVPRLEIPTDHPRPPTETHAGEEVRFELPLPLARRVHAFARELDVTSYMVLLSAFAALLSRYARQRDIAIGTPIANRTHPELEELIGFIVNTLVMRVDLDGQPSFRSLVERVRDVAIDAYDHQDVPFERLVAELAPDRDLSRSPLFQAVFALQNTPNTEVPLGDLTLSPLELPSGVAKFDLTLFLHETPHGLRGLLEYNSDLFERRTAESIARHYVALLSRMLDDPRKPVARVPILLEGELEAQLRVNDESVRFRGGPGMHDLFSEMAQSHPSRQAIVHEDETLTFAQLDDRSTRIAAALAARGLGRGELIGVSMKRTPTMIATLLGVLKSGAAYVPLDPSWPVDRLRYMVTDSAAKLVVVDRDDHDLGEDTELIAVESLLSAGDDPSFVPAKVIPEERSYVLYTSGSTGRPKGIELTHRSAGALIQWARTFFEPEELEAVLAGTSISWDVSIFELFGTLCSGGTLYLVESALELATLPQRDQIRLLCIVPSVMEALLQLGPLPDSVRAINYGGEALLRPLVRDSYAHPNVRRVNNFYGPSEDTTYSTWWTALRDYAGTPGIGLPVAATRTYILDEHLQPVPAGVIGELHLGGLSLARGYRHRFAMTAEKFVPDPFGEPGGRMYRTGDLVRWRPDGALEYHGRSDNLVKLRGFRIELGEIESVLGSHESVSSCAVKVVEIRPRQHALVAYLVSTEGEADEAELLVLLRSRLPEYMVPSVIVQLDAFPRTPNGKISRRELPLPELSQASDDRPYEAPTTDTEKAFAEVWASVLHIDRVGLDDSFFALGGDSILSIQVVSRARDAGWSVSPRQVFQHPTLRALAASAKPFRTTAEQGPVTGPAPLAPAQRWLLEQGQPEVNHYNQALLFKLEAPVDGKAFAEAVQVVVRHHDLLRARYLGPDGGWQQEIAAEADPWWKEVEVAPGDAALASELDALQRGFHLQGPLFGAAQLALGGDGHRLWVGAHHLVVDGVSWRILLEDLWWAYERLLAGETPELPTKTTSFKRWGTLLEGYAQGQAVERELPFWQRQLEGLAPLPRDLDEGDDRLEAEEEVVVDVDASTTSRLLGEVPDTLQASVEEVLVAALARALGRWQGHDTVGIELEGHGRETLFEGEDVSRTVGWFTSIYPLRISLSGAVEPSDALGAVKIALDAVPRGGVGYGLLRYLGRPEVAAELRDQLTPEVVFNYLGQLDLALPGDTPLTPATESAGTARSPATRRVHLLEVLAYVRDGALRVGFGYSTRRHHRATVEALAEDFRGTVESLIGHAEEEMDDVLGQLDLDDF